MTRIVFRLGSLIPTTEILEVGEPVFDPDKFRVGFGLGNDQPLWYPRIDAENQDLVNIGNSLHRSEVGGKLARFGWTAPDQFLMVGSQGTMMTVNYSAANIRVPVAFSAGGTLSGDYNTDGGRFTTLNIRALVVNATTDRISLINGDTGKEIGAIDNRGVTSIAQRDMMLVLAAYMENQAALNRNAYASGFVAARGRDSGRAFNLRVKQHRGSVAAMNIHNHPDWQGFAGLGECSFLVNGHHLQTRHIDYRTMRPIRHLTFGTRSLNTGVPVPSSVLSKATGYTGVTLSGSLANSQVEWMRNVYTDSPENCVFELAYLECWFQKWNGKITDIGSNSRYPTDERDYKRILEKQHWYARSGINNPRENFSLPNGVVATWDSEGHPVLAYLNWRVNSLPVATLSSKQQDVVMDGFTYSLRALPFDRERAINGVTDGFNRFVLRRTLQDFIRETKIIPSEDNLFLGKVNYEDLTRWEKLLDSPFAMFDVENLGALCRMVPGFEGLGSYEDQIFDDPFRTKVNGASTDYIRYSPNNERGFFYYDNKYHLNSNDPMGDSLVYRGFNDNNLFTARTTHPEVIGGWSYMIPLELILRTPRENWNPFNIARQAKVTGSGSSGKPYNGWNENGQFFRIPKDALVASTRTTPADTRHSAFMSTVAGTKEFWASGIRMFDITGERTRFPIVPEALRFNTTEVELSYFKERVRNLMVDIASQNLTGNKIDNAY